MYSMYEKLMSLPLFKGASQEMIHNFAEKTPLEFSRYEDRQTVIRPSDVCASVKCLISGTVVKEQNLCCGEISLREYFGAGVVLGVERLFGLDTKYGCRVKAVDSCGIMEFPKKHYVQLLQSSQLFMINYLNYLSRLAQNCANSLRKYRYGNMESELGFLIQTATSPLAEKIEIESADKPIWDLFGRDEREGIRKSENLTRRGAVEILSDKVLLIPSRAALLDIFDED